MRLSRNKIPVALTIFYRNRQSPDLGPGKPAHGLFIDQRMSPLPAKTFNRLMGNAETKPAKSRFGVAPKRLS